MGDQRENCNYNGICIKSAIPKFLNAVFICLQEDEQHGFTSGRRTVTNSLCFEDFLWDIFEHELQGGYISTDLTKVFDRINRKLLSKIGSFVVHI